MIIARSAASTAIALLLTATSARAAPHALRSLVYHAEILITNARAVQVDKIGTVTGGNTDNYSKALRAIGSISADVIAVTSDGGIVIDVHEDTDERKAPVVRVAVGRDGTLYYDPKQSVNLTDEERTLVGMLGRGFVADQALSVGRSWTTSFATDNVRSRSTYTLKSPPNDGVMRFAYESITSGTGPHGFSAARYGTIDYHAARSVPVSVQYTDRSRADTIEQTDATDIAVTLSLVSDSFENR